MPILSRRSLVAFLASCLAVGCGEPLPEETVTAVPNGPDWWGVAPSRESLTVPLPLYRVTYAADLARELTSATTPALDVIDRITEGREPEVMPGGRLSWRTRPGASESNVWRLTMTNRTGAWTYPGPGGAGTGTVGKPAQLWSYELEIKHKLAPDAAFRVILDGHRETPAGDVLAARGSGSIHIDWTAACEFAPTLSPCLGQYQAAEVRLSYELAPEARTLRGSLRNFFWGGGHKEVSLTASANADTSGTVRFTSAYTSRNSFPDDVVRVTWAASDAGVMSKLEGVSGIGGVFSGMRQSVQCWDATRGAFYTLERGVSGAPIETFEIGDVSACPGGAVSLP
ncbi:hypothetical protein F0U62_18695 [Cystobacter fuscus]|uniref:hypothetical protein n=1 Tax=Cystobacter fuscus TaxID=43 RepID=UPI002B308436|nr:hypothetical protein F0U62_18695 [Cystobacter fuscus]